MLTLRAASATPDLSLAGARARLARPVNADASLLALAAAALCAASALLLAGAVIFGGSVKGPAPSGMIVDPAAATPALAPPA